MSEYGKNAPHDLASWERKIKEMSKLQPIYTPDRVRPVTALKYDCTVWLTEGQTFPTSAADAITNTEKQWKTDGIILNHFRLDENMVQILFTSSPKLDPTTFVSRVKGRLQYSLRKAGTPVKFSRKVSFRSLGENISAAVAGYLKKQVRKEKFVDPRFAKRMETFTVMNDDIDLAKPYARTRGRYWYNIHLVFAVAGRKRIAQNSVLEKLRDGCLAIARKKGCGIKALSVMLDHVHIALRGVPDQPPEDIALAFMNNLAWLLGQNRIWEDEYYLGTFSEYAISDLALQRGKPVGGEG